MSRGHVIENLLRPAVELYSAAAGLAAGTICLVAPWSLMLAPVVSWPLAAGFFVLAGIRAQQGLHILRYRRNLRRLPRYVITSARVPVSRHTLFIGKGFRMEQKHAQRLYQCRQPEAAQYLRPGWLYRQARGLEKACDVSLPVVRRLLSCDHWLNPVRPLPPVGGSPLLHGVEMNETDVTLPLGERVGHTLVMGTTRVGKTRLAEIFITQDIRRGEVVIIFDPKGDADLLRRAYAETKRAGREKAFYVFHLGWPDISARYNAVGRFGRISEVASRIAGQLSGEGNSAAFKEFAWRFVNIISRALIELGQRPDYLQISRHVINIDDLFIRYAQYYLPEHEPKAWDIIAQIAGKVTEKNTPRNLQGRDKYVVALEQYLAATKVYDPILDGLRSAVRYDKTYFDKIVASLLPLLEKLTTGKTAQLLAPSYSDLDDPRPIFDWQQIIRKRGVVYVGLDALSDAEVAAAVGNSMFADLVSIAGYIYKFGVNEGLPGENTAKVPVNLHCDEFNELMGDEFIPLINKGGGAGIQVTAYTQTLSDIEARIGSHAKAGQVIGNFNNLIMLRVRETATAELMTGQLHNVDILTSTVMSGVTDASGPDSGSDFTSNTMEHVSAVSAPLIEPAALIQLPKGQAFALLEGGQLWKIRMPLPAAENDALMPQSIATLAEQMQASYRTGEQWWSGAIMPESQGDSAALLASLEEGLHE
ncbi:type IV conjugative transfer system coupling protein TraD [Citrobacter sp. S2-9]|uniref:Type IV conjugative transfer system coupling protein TraD n=1 Tax=Citrobacter enshiensis TaxID=2971264 RepID=A0ABT8PVB9_9ENTR|nr:type IV conjugative transfer system coupling protein TraD [Citrobacter enshiensis]MDN8600299.1 type IV conjugative transfer system coupling protein TraD [Citrobacter enshiensis]